MPISLSGISPEHLKRHVRQLSGGELLFEQGHFGNTMFIVVTGTLTLLEKRAEKEFVIGTVSSGEILGEKAILTQVPYRRAFTARAEDGTTLLEFDSKHVRLIESIIPNFTSRMLEMAAKRLDRVNELVSLLRSLDPIERVVNAILFLCKDVGKPLAEGVTLVLNAEEINQICHVDIAIIQDCLDLLISAKIIHLKNGEAIIRDLNAVQQYFPDLKERVAA